MNFNFLKDKLKNLGKVNSILVFFIVVFFLSSALYGFPDSPSPWFDPGINLGIARTYAEDGIFTLRLSPGEYVQNRPLMTTTNYPLFLPLSISFKLFGVGLAQAKLVMFLFLLAFLILAFVLVKKWYGIRSALFGVALVVTFLPLYGNGMSGGLGEVPGLFYLLLGLLFLEKEKNWQIFFCGLFFGLCGATKVFYLVILGALGASELYKAVKEKNFPIKRWILLALGIAIPLIIWMRTLLPDGLSLLGAKQALEYYRNPYSVGSTIFSNIIKFFTETTLIHFLILAVAFLSFFAIHLWKRKLYQGEILLFIFFILNILFFLRTPGWFRYLFPAHIILLLFFPVAISTIVKFVPLFREKKYITPTIIIFFIAVQSVHLIGQRNNTLYHNSAPRLFVRDIEQTLEGESDIFVIDKPEIWFLLKSKTTRQYINVNPYIQLGEDIFDSGNLPGYIVSGEPGYDEYLLSHEEKFTTNYERTNQRGSYILFTKKKLENHLTDGHFLN